MTEPALNPALMVCPHCGEDEKIWIHSQKERRFKCVSCHGTFSERRGTPLFGLGYPSWVVILVLALLAGGCPIPAIVFAFGLDERTVADWQQKAGDHAQRVQQEKVCQGQLESQQIQGDEMWVKTQFGAVWMATAMDVFSRLFIWGAVSIERNTTLTERVVVKVAAALRRGQPLMWVTDGFGGWKQAIASEMCCAHHISLANQAVLVCRFGLSCTWFKSLSGKRPVILFHLSIGFVLVIGQLLKCYCAKLKPSWVRSTRPISSGSMPPFVLGYRL
jgi:transposase-like protein